MVIELSPTFSTEPTITPENQKKGQLVRAILSKYLARKAMTDTELVGLCDSLFDKNLEELHYLEHLYNPPNSLK